MPPKKPKKKTEPRGFPDRKNAEMATIGDLWNPWIFYSVFDREPYKVQEWLRKVGILADSMLCVCGKDMKLNLRSHSPEDYTWRCHRCDSECNVRKNSWFTGFAWIFYRVFDREPYKVQEWLRKEGILADQCFACVVKT